MGWILLILLALFLIIFLSIIVILYFGFSVSAELNIKEMSIESGIDFKWLKFTIYHLNFPDDEKKLKEKKIDIEKENDDEKLTLSDKLEKFTYIIKCKINPLLPYIKEALNPFLEFLITGSKAFKLNLFYLNFIIGFEDTSSTALTVGYIWAFASILNIFPVIDISAIPDFEKEIMDLYSKIIIKFYPLKVIKASIKLMTRKPMLKLMFNVVKVLV